MSIWIIGPTGSGKSTLGKILAERLSLTVLEAGQFCRWACAADAKYDVLADRAVELLTTDHRHFSRLILQETRQHNLVIVGVRNPVDFVDSFDPSTDRLLLLDAGSEPKPGFEAQGIEAITAIAKFFLTTGILEAWRVVQLVAQKENEDWYASALCSF